MLQEAQRTSAPSAFSVSISTAVWIVMCSEPAIRAPLSGCEAAYSARVAIRPGHFGFGDGDFLPPEGGEADIGDGVVGGFGHGVKIPVGFGAVLISRNGIRQ